MATLFPVGVSVEQTSGRMERGVIMSGLELNLTERIRRDYSVEGMEDIFLRLDLLHTYASVGRLDDVTTLSSAELRGWLEELIYTARETLREMGET